MPNLLITTYKASTGASKFGSVNTATGAFTSISTLASRLTSDIGYDPVSGKVVIGDNIIDPSWTSKLTSLSPTTGASSTLGYIDPPERPVDIVFKPNGTMYILGLHEPENISRLWLLNRSTLSITSTYIFPSGKLYTGITFDEYGNLYCIGRTGYPPTGNAVVLKVAPPYLTEEVICDLTTAVGPGTWKNFKSLVYFQNKLYTIYQYEGSSPLVCIDVATKIASVLSYFDGSSVGYARGITIVFPYEEEIVTTTTGTDTTTTPTTTTTTTTTTTPTTTSTTTTPTTTTTTTTTLPPRSESLRKVETVLVTPSIQSVGNDASNNKGTINTIISDALSFGTLAPGETSATKIIYLRVPYARIIKNIKLALVGDGDIPFTTTTFGIESHNYIDYNLVPSSYFQGINEDNDSNNVNNISISNGTNISSQYVYLNVNVPTDFNIGLGVIKIKWYFDYA